MPPPPTSTSGPVPWLPLLQGMLFWYSYVPLSLWHLANTHFSGMRSWTTTTTCLLLSFSSSRLLLTHYVDSTASKPFSSLKCKVDKGTVFSAKQITAHPVPPRPRYMVGAQETSPCKWANLLLLVRSAAPSRRARQPPRPLPSPLLVFFATLLVFSLCLAPGLV